MSYAHSDDGKAGRLSKFRERLSEELQSHTGRHIEIFKDDDIELGEQWRKRLEEGLATSTFLLPILTPSYLMSQYCCDELQTFLEHERALGRDDLVLPVYYIDCKDFLAGVSDEQALATWKLVEARQHSDWRELNFRPPSDQRVQRQRTKLAKQIQKAMARAAAKPSAGQASSPSTTSTPKPEPLPLEALCDPDPMTSRAAAKQIAERGPEGIPLVVDRLHGLSEPTRFVFRELLSQFPDASGPLMVERIKLADRQWQHATQVPECLSPAHREVCLDDLTAPMRGSIASEIDVVRKSIEALGYVGAVERSQEISEFLGKRAGALTSDLYDKYGSYCVLALARIVDSTSLQPPFLERSSDAFYYLESAVQLVASRGWQSLAYPTMMQILSRYDAHHADRFLSHWLSSPREDMRNLGAYALGGMGLRRAVPSLLERCEDPDESSDVRAMALFATGVIGGAEALTGLDALELEGELGAARDDALTTCVIDAEDETQFRQLVPRLIDAGLPEPGWVYRAIGRRGDETLLDLVREGLQASETSVRGDAALALARLAGPGERERLLRARDEASSTRERLLSSLAVLATGEAPPDDPKLDELRAVLAAESFLYRSLTQTDIVETLRASTHPLAPDLAAAWEPMYASSSAY